MFAPDFFMDDHDALHEGVESYEIRRAEGGALVNGTEDYTAACVYDCLVRDCCHLGFLDLLLGLGVSISFPVDSGLARRCKGEIEVVSENDTNKFIVACVYDCLARDCCRLEFLDLLLGFIVSISSLVGGGLARGCKDGIDAPIPSDVIDHVAVRSLTLGDIGCYLEFDRRCGDCVTLSFLCVALGGIG